MAATQAYLELTIKSSGDTLALTEENLISMVGEASDADTRITYLTDNKTVNSILLEDTVAELLVLAVRLTPFTLVSDGSTLYLNRDRIKATFVDGTGSINKVDVEDSAWEQFKFTESQSAVATLINGA